MMKANEIKVKMDAAYEKWQKRIKETPARYICRMTIMLNTASVWADGTKAEISINGAYPMVCRELVRMLRERHPELVYINREDDMGLEALRKSKESYKPVYLLRKYAARWIGA